MGYRDNFLLRAKLTTYPQLRRRGSLVNKFILVGKVQFQLVLILGPLQVRNMS